MFCDLNISKPDQNVDIVLQDTIKRAVKYGYRTFAITTNVDETVFQKAKKDKLKKVCTDETVNIIPEPLDFDKLKSTYPNKYFCNRLNIKVSDSANIRKFIQCKEVKKYELISFEPENQEVLKSLLGVSLIHILSFNPESKCDLTFNRKLYNQFVNQNVFFEITYGPGISDATARRNLLIISHVYKAVGNSKNIIVSSGAQVAHQIRGPYDVINFNLLFGLNEQQSRNSITKNCEKLLLIAGKYGKVPIVLG